MEWRDITRNLPASSLNPFKPGVAARLSRAQEMTTAGLTEEVRKPARQAYLDGKTRAESVSICLAASRQDGEFKEWVRKGDGERDVGDWPAAEFSYWRALSLHPFHHDYRVQYAHMIKEAGKWAAAEVQYRSALALGADLDDVSQHLDFVLDRQGLPPERLLRRDLAVKPMLAPPTFMDINALAYITWFESELSKEEHLWLLRACSTCDECAAKLINHSRFADKNQSFLAMLEVA